MFPLNHLLLLRKDTLQMQAFEIVFAWDNPSNTRHADIVWATSKTDALMLFGSAVGMHILEVNYA